MRYPTLLLALLVCQVCLAQNKTVRKFYRQYKHGPEAHSATIPGPLVWLGTSIAKGMVKSPEEKIMLKLARRFGTTRFLYAPAPDAHAATDVKLLVADLQTRNGYDPLISVSNAEAEVYIMGKENGKSFKRLLILVQGEDGIMLLSGKSRLKYKKVNQYMRQLMRHYRKGEAIPDKDPPAPKAPKQAPKDQV